MLLVNYMSTCFGRITTIIRPTKNIAWEHIMCTCYGIPYHLHNWYTVSNIGNYDI